MLAFARLEIRKYRLLSGGLLGAFVFSLPLMALVGYLTGWPAGQSVDTALLFWTRLGLPLAAVLFGASGGAGLLAGPDVGAEAALPLSPRRKAAEALLAQVLHLTALGVVVLGLSLTASSGWRLAVIGGPYAEPLVGQFMTLAGFGLLYILVLSFIFSYILRRGVLGGAVGLFAAAPALCAMGVTMGLERVFMARARLPLSSGEMMAVALAGCAPALVAMPGWLEHREGLGRRGPALALAVLLAGAWFPAGGFYADSLAAAGAHHVVLAREAAPAAPDGGLLMTSASGDLVSLTPEGRRSILIPGKRRGALDLVSSAAWRVVSCEYEEDGSLWVLREWDPHTAYGKGRRRFELWHGRVRGPLGLHARFLVPNVPLPVRLASHGGRLVLLIRTAFAEIPAPGREPAWRSFALSATWKAYESGPRVGVPEPAAEELARRYRLSRHRDGMVWGVSDEDPLLGLAEREVVYSAGADGRSVRALSMAPIVKTLEARPRQVIEHLDLLHVDGSRVWGVRNGHQDLVEADAATGRVVGDWELPAGSAQMTPDSFAVVPSAKGGLFLCLYSLGRVYFVGWDGSWRYLGGL